MHWNKVHLWNHINCIFNEGVKVKVQINFHGTYYYVYLSSTSKANISRKIFWVKKPPKRYDRGGKTMQLAGSSLQILNNLCLKCIHSCPEANLTITVHKHSTLWSTLHHWFKVNFPLFRIRLFHYIMILFCTFGCFWNIVYVFCLIDTIFVLN